MKESERKQLGVPVVNRIIGGVLIMVGSLGVIYGAIDCVNITLPSVKKDIGKEWDKAEVPLPASWDQAYNRIMRDDRDRRIGQITDYASGFGGVVTLVIGLERFSRRRIRRY